MADVAVRPPPRPRPQPARPQQASEASVIKIDKTGGRTVELLIPFKYNGVDVTEVVIAPFTLDHLMRWQEGKFSRPGASSLPTILAFLAAMTGMRNGEEVLRQMRYPDVDRVIGAFFDMVPPPVRDSMMGGDIPQVPEATEGAAPAAENYPADPKGPMPPAEDVGGFDIGEESQQAAE